MPSKPFAYSHGDIICEPQNGGQQPYLTPLYQHYRDQNGREVVQPLGIVVRGWNESDCLWAAWAKLRELEGRPTPAYFDTLSPTGDVED